MQNLKTLRSEKRHAGKVFNLIVDEIEYPSGNRGIREVAEHPGGSVVVPMLDSKTVMLIRQFRYPIKDYLYELPAGKLDNGEDPARCAERELEEETGYGADSLTKLTAIYTTPGFVRNNCTFISLRGCTNSHQANTSKKEKISLLRLFLLWKRLQ